MTSCQGDRRWGFSNIQRGKLPTKKRTGLAFCTCTMIIKPTATAATGAIGFSLSPGGLLYPYHVGILSSLDHYGFLTPHTPLAGASAGAIAAVSHAAQVKPEVCLDTTVKISEECVRRGGARGRLLPLLEAELDAILDENAHHIVNERPGMTALAHFELFPKFRPVLETHFETRECLKEAVLNSSMFPFFSTNWPVRFSKQTKNRQNKGVLGSLPRIVMDGYFAVPFSRFGCPDFRMAERGNFVMEMEDEVEAELASQLKQKASTQVDRTVTVSVFPHDSVLMTDSSEHDRISPIFNQEDPIGQVKELLERATQPLTRSQVHELYESGWADAERWVKEESERVKLRDALLKEKAEENI